MRGKEKITVASVKERVALLARILGNNLMLAIRELAAQGDERNWVIAACDGSDDRARQVYAKLGPSWEALPTNGAMTVACPADRLESTIAEVGYRRSENPFGPHVPGTVRVAFFTRQVMLVQKVRLVEMDVAGNA